MPIMSAAKTACPALTRRTAPSTLRGTRQEVHDRRLSVGRIRRRISVDLPRMAGGLPPVRRHPFCDRVVRLVHAVVRPAVDGDGSFAPRRFGRVHLARSFKCACDLDAEVAEYRRARLLRVAVEKDVVTVS